MIKKFDISLVMPCYNEEVAIKVTAPNLLSVFAQDGVDLELVLVDNGSTDGTSRAIDELVEMGYPVKKLTFNQNQGYGGGILEGLKVCEAPIIGYLCADGQVSAKDTLMSYWLIRGREGRTLAKVRRRFRRDSWKRKLVSIAYNGLMQLLFGWLGAIDINGSPKVFSKRAFEDMQLKSRDWFLDPEIIIKAKYLKLRAIEVDVEGYERKGGASNVNIMTSLEFLKNILRFKFGNALVEWKSNIKRTNGYRDHDELEMSTEIGTQLPLNLSNHRLHSLDEVRILTQKRHEDSRGFVHKVLSASQCNGIPPSGEVYVTSAKAGESKGNHYHLEMGEWFTVVQGEGEIKLCDPKSGKGRSIQLSASVPRTVYVPAGIAHSIANTGNGLLICVAWAEKEYNQKDVYPFKIITAPEAK